MKNELNSMVSNGVLILVEVPNRAKAVASKWVFKAKKNSLGNFERCKARQLVKGFIKRREMTTLKPFMLY